ncbi:hypothetical protein H632_c823p2 [Helicosporidium sp. ATCC 50920]|nr:hypothetical protein H632_c823p2 [Helicosporidium sp. ATCC 50920]|eukprot:KDD75182.1 hypothetical protein H632_c823p2 [Helicosporidium sp. ATCC 50920]
MSQVTQTYRRVLKTVDRHITRVSQNSEFRKFVQSEFRKGAALRLSAEERDAKLALATDWAQLQDDVVGNRVRPSISRSAKERARTTPAGCQQNERALISPQVSPREQELLMSYNIGIDPVQRARDGYKRAAAYVGLRLPEVEAADKPEVQG